MMRRVVLYTKADCHLCDEAKAILGRLRDEYSLSVEEVDITRDPHLFERYRNVIPVVAIEGRPELEAPISEFRLRQMLRT